MPRLQKLGKVNTEDMRNVAALVGAVVAIVLATLAVVAVGACFILGIAKDFGQPSWMVMDVHGTSWICIDLH